MLVLLAMNAGWSRGIMRGLNVGANAHGWNMLVHDPRSDVNLLVESWAPSAILVGSDEVARALSARHASKLVSLAVDRSADGIASVYVDEGAVGHLAAEHLLATGVRNVAVFRRNEQHFALAREQAFNAQIARTKVRLASGFCPPGAPEHYAEEDYGPVVAWLKQLPKPCGIFACTDFWGKTVALCARAAGLLIPEELAIVGVDNDTLQCEAIVPQLSSVLVPWQEIGEAAAELARAIIAGEPLASKRVSVLPLGVKARRSTELLAIEDEVVAKAVRFIRAHVAKGIRLDELSAFVDCGRQRLERRFRRSLDRTIQDEIRRSRVDAARQLLETTTDDLKEIARRSGFPNATLLNHAFKRELNMAPGAYRQRVAEEAGSDG